MSVDQKQVKQAPSLAIGDSGAAYVVWQQAGTKSGIWFCSLPLGGATWTSPLQISDPAFDHIAPDIGVNSSGRLVAIYTNGVTALYSRIRPAGSSTWGTAALVYNQSGLNAPALSVRADGAAYVAWTATQVLWGARLNPANGVWVDQAQLSPNGLLFRPSVALRAGNAEVVAEFGTGTQANVRGYQTPVP